ncbi:hypothetical protein ABIE41_003776 [Bosea sp. OAE506]
MRDVTGFDFGVQPSLDKAQIREIATGRFIASGEAVLLLGPPGVCKTQLAVAPGAKPSSPATRSCSRRRRRWSRNWPNPQPPEGRSAWKSVPHDENGSDPNVVGHMPLRRLRPWRRAHRRYATLITKAKLDLDDVDPQAWLAGVLARIAGLSQVRLAKTLPWNWQTVRADRLDAASRPPTPIS